MDRPLAQMQTGSVDGPPPVTCSTQVLHLIVHLEPRMSTTTIRIDEELKSRVAMAAQRAGKTPHAFIVEAIARTVEQVEWDEAFERLADDRWALLMANERTVAWSDTKAWLEARARGEPSRRPSARKLKR